MERECSLLLNQLSTLNYPKYLLRSHEYTLLPPSEFDVATYTLHVIIRFLLTDAVPVFTQYLRQKGSDISNDDALIGTFYQAMQKTLRFTPKICPDAFTDRLPGGILQFEKLYYERLRTVRVFAKLLIQLQCKWARMSTKRGLDNRHFMVLLDNTCDVAAPAADDLGKLVRLTQQVVDPKEGRPERYNSVLVVPVNEIDGAMLEKLRRQFQTKEGRRDAQLSDGGVSAPASPGCDGVEQCWARPSRVSRKTGRGVAGRPALKADTHRRRLQKQPAKVQKDEISSSYDYYSSEQESDLENADSKLSASDFSSSDPEASESGSSREKTSRKYRKDALRKHNAGQNSRSSGPAPYKAQRKTSQQQKGSGKQPKRQLDSSESVTASYGFNEPRNELRERDHVVSQAEYGYVDDGNNRRELDLQSTYKTALDYTPNELTGSKQASSDSGKQNAEEIARSKRINDLIYGAQLPEEPNVGSIVDKYLGQSSAPLSQPSFYQQAQPQMEQAYDAQIPQFGSNFFDNQPVDPAATQNRAYPQQNYELIEPPSNIPETRPHVIPSYQTNTMMNQPTSYYDYNPTRLPTQTPVQIPVYSPKFGVPQSVSEANINQMRELQRSSQMAPEVDVTDVPSIMLPNENVLASTTPYDITAVPDTVGQPKTGVPCNESTISLAGAPQNMTVHSAYESVPDYKEIRVIPPPKSELPRQHFQREELSDGIASRTADQLYHNSSQLPASDSQPPFAQASEQSSNAGNRPSAGPSAPECSYQLHSGGQTASDSRDSGYRLLDAAQQKPTIYTLDRTQFDQQFNYGGNRVSESADAMAGQTSLPVKNSAIDEILQKYREYLPSVKEQGLPDGASYQAFIAQIQYARSENGDLSVLVGYQQATESAAFARGYQLSYADSYYHFPQQPTITTSMRSDELHWRPEPGLSGDASAEAFQSTSKQSTDRKSVSFVPEVELRFETGRLTQADDANTGLLQEDSYLHENDVRKGITISSNSYDDQIRQLTHNFVRPDIPRLSGGSEIAAGGQHSSKPPSVASGRSVSSGAQAGANQSASGSVSQRFYYGDPVQVVVRTIADQLNQSAHILNEITDSGLSNMSASYRQLYETYKALQQAQRLIKQSRVSFSRSEASDGLKRDEMLKELEELKKSERLLQQSREQRKRIDLTENQNTARLHALLEKGQSLLKDMSAIGGINFSSEENRETEDIDRRSSLQSSTK